MVKSVIEPEQVLALLAAAPERIAAPSGALTPEQLRTSPGAGEWSANDVLAHLRACADVWGGCITAMLAEDHPTLRAVNPRTWIKQTDYPALEFAGSLQAFRQQRAALLARLEALSPDDWHRGATVTGAGKPLERTVYFYAHWLASHERPHVKQIASIAARLRAPGRQAGDGQPR